MTSKRELTELERVLGWTFNDETVLNKALTHSTYANENPDEGPDYERLEFLGDAVLDLVAARILFERLRHAATFSYSRAIHCAGTGIGVPFAPILGRRSALRGSCMTTARLPQLVREGRPRKSKSH